MYNDISHLLGLYAYTKDKNILNYTLLLKKHLIINFYFNIWIILFYVINNIFSCIFFFIEFTSY
jgi:hypothetical protein